MFRFQINDDTSIGGLRTLGRKVSSTTWSTIDQFIERIDYAIRDLYLIFCSINSISHFESSFYSGFAPESDFLEKIKAIDGVSLVETQTITNMEIN